MSAAQPHIRAVAKSNPNHDEHGRFASDEGGDADKLDEDDEGSYQDDDQEKFDKHDEVFGKHQDDIEVTHSAIAGHLSALKDLNASLGKSQEKAERALDGINDIRSEYGQSEYDADNTVVGKASDLHGSLGDALSSDDLKNHMKALAKHFDKSVAPHLIKSATGLASATRSTSVPAPLRMFIPLTKVDAETRTVYGIATGETADRCDEICDYASTKPLYEAWSADIAKASGGKSLGNLRAMHGKIAAGKVTSINFNDDAKQIEIAAKVVDDNEWQKVVEGVYTGFSQGGAYEKRWKDPATGLQRYTAAPSEVSLVDLPCLPTATFQMIKAAGAVETKHFKPVVDVKPTNEAIMAKATELAKASGKEQDVPSFFEPAREALLKAALPAPPEVAGEIVAATPPTPGDGLEQVWKAKDGSTFAKKADALAHNAALDATPSTKAALDAIAGINEKLGITKAGDVPGTGTKKPGEGDDQTANGGATATNTKAAKKPRIAPNGQAMKAATVEDLRKNLFRVSRLAELLASLKAMQENAEVDALYGFGEQQDPDIATQMKGWLAQGCSLLIAIVQRESDKLVGDVDDDMMMAAGSKLTAGQVAALIKIGGDVPQAAALVEKTGKRNSKADQDTIQAMHDHACALGASCDAENCGDDDDASKARASGELTKALAGMTSERDLAKARGDALQKAIDDQILPMLKTIGERVENIEKQPLPLPLQNGATRVVTKGAEEVSGTEISDRLSKMKVEDPEQYALLMFKLAQQNPQPISYAR